MAKRIVRRKGNKPGSETPARKKGGNPRWTTGVSGNPSGRPKLPAEIALIKRLALEKAITLLADIVHDEDYLKAIKPSESQKFLETAFDRFGLPKVTRAELTGKDGAPIRTHTDLTKLPKKALEKLAE